MAAMYQIINVKVDKGEFKGNAYDNRKILVYCDNKPDCLVAGDNTDTLKMKASDFSYTMRSRNYTNGQLAGAGLKPEFDRNGNVVDFQLINENGEVI